MAIRPIEILDDVILDVKLYVRKLDGYSQSLAMHRYGNHHAELMIRFEHIGEHFKQIHSNEPISKEQVEEFTYRIEDLRETLSQKTAHGAFAYITSIARETFEDKEETSVAFKTAYDMREHFEIEKFEDEYEIAWEPAKSSLQYFVDRRRKIISSHKDAIDVLSMKDLKWLNLRIRRNKHSFYRSITFYNNRIYVFMNDVISNIEMRPVVLVEESFEEVQRMIAEELTPKLAEFDIDASKYVRKILAY